MGLSLSLELQIRSQKTGLTLPFCWPGLLFHRWSCINLLYPKPGLASPLDLLHFNGLQFLSLSLHLG